MLLLCLDSSAAASVAVVDTDAGSPRVLASWETPDTRAHAEVLAPAVDTVLDRAQVAPGGLGGVLVGTGPGPFTGLRAGLATARTLAFAWRLPCYGMCSLAAIAHVVARLPAASRPPQFVVASDARRREVYWAVYSASSDLHASSADPAGVQSARLIDGPFVGPAEDVPGLPVFGRGAGLYADRLRQPVKEVVPGALQTGSPAEWQPHAGFLGLAAAATVNAGGTLSQDTAPLYLRESDAKVPGPRKKATA
ncbi:tRNA (adenosine(37)-N6)-threonylcarbamoyltransferase complex dimerization subunit type 1 TsaB [Kocuria coralli]|uniref:tRNA (Adenosine(37)-N6)-threonylcarbamoyltransferase complex dimerization subunit type 1 TsaB n=1 Tax=Kocuria coralli TaxID=1461025 RepID=A0A5J5KVM8_9MICC|nr:tRNA (adenosine(37)-N6)-threonylcarbamoyltransferase complex dimerization subunit type 1 TsaB [Kocuria coralli]KAA9393634.1 tRNA (adenosine(37)-N6)-threonylcarbamoyltransferase complex dimerization subunit type 1 TsaB [Kocuria coralli]